MEPPDPGQAGTLDDLVEMLRLLKVWAGDPSYERITDRVNADWTAAGRPAGELARRTTVADCFRPGRRRLNADLVVAVVHALHPDVGYMAQWRQALRVIGGETQAAAQVRVQDTLPNDLPEFTGRAHELGQLRQASPQTAVCAIVGLAGVGKTRLAVHAAHDLLRQKAFERVLFVNLRGYHSDPGQPPADPAAVLDGFLRLLGMPGQQIPHDLPARMAAYRRRLAGIRALVVLDNAADVEQIRPLLPDTPGCLTLITSRRDLAGLQSAKHLAVDVFSAGEAVELLTRAVPEVPAGSDPHAPARIAHRCGHLPLALSLIAGHIRGTPGWTMTDHAERLDERHHHGRLESGVELALDLSYQHLTADQQRLLRLAALHPGQDLDAHAAAALADTDLSTTDHDLRHLCRDHLLQQAASGRYAFHDLVRAYAAGRGGDQDRPPDRRAALTRLFDFYLATAATAMDVAYPYERELRPTVPPANARTPDLPDQKRADWWLDTELANLLAVAQHAAENGWPEHTWQLSTTLDPHLRTRGRHLDAETLHQHALALAHHLGNLPAEMYALNGLGTVGRTLGRAEQARDHYELALRIAQRIGDRRCELNVQFGLGRVHWLLGRYEQAGHHYERALQIARDLPDADRELHTMIGLGHVHGMTGGYWQADGYFEGALRIAQRIGHRRGEQQALNSLGGVHRRLGRYEQARDTHWRSLQIARDIGDRGGELYVLNGLGAVHRALGQHEEAADHYERALQIAHEIGDRNAEMRALNGLGHVQRMLGRHGEAAGHHQRVIELAREINSNNWLYEAQQGLGRMHLATGRPDLALAHHEQALQLATELTAPADQARAHDGLAHAHHADGRHDQARRHWQRALDILVELDAEYTDEVEASAPNIRARLADLD